MQSLGHGQQVFMGLHGDSAGLSATLLNIEVGHIWSYCMIPSGQNTSLLRGTILPLTVLDKKILVMISLSHLSLSVTPQLHSPIIYMVPCSEWSELSIFSALDLIWEALKQNNIINMFCFFDRCSSWGRWRKIRHPGVHWLGQKKRRRGQEGNAGKQVCPQGPPSPLLPHPQQPHPHGSTGPSGVEISFLEGHCMCGWVGGCQRVRVMVCVTKARWIWCTHVMCLWKCARGVFLNLWIHKACSPLNCSPQALWYFHSTRHFCQLCCHGCHQAVPWRWL